MSGTSVRRNFVHSQNLKHLPILPLIAHASGAFSRYQGCVHRPKPNRTPASDLADNSKELKRLNGWPVQVSASSHR